MEDCYIIPEVTARNINYQWWCQKCQDWHGSPYCPWDEIGIPYIDCTAEYGTYEICPHCGQLIKRQY